MKFSERKKWDEDSMNEEDKPWPKKLKNLSTPSDEGDYSKTFTNSDTDVMELFEKICWIFDVKEEGFSFVNISEIQKYYDLLEKGYKLSAYQIRRLENAYLFAKKYHERIANIAIEMFEAEQKDSSRMQELQKFIESADLSNLSKQKK